MTPSLVLLGNLLVDDVVQADGTTRMAQAGGALLYGALGAALWGARAGLVSVAGSDYPAAVLEAVQQRGVDLSGVHHLDRPGVRTWLLYEGSVRRLIHRLGCPTHEEVSPRPVHIPPEWDNARAFHLSPMPFDAQRDLIAALRAPTPPRTKGAAGTPARESAFVSVDPHLPVTEATLSEWRKALSDVDAFFAGEDELLLDDAHSDPRQALPRLVSGRLRFVVFKRGAQGGIVFDARDEHFYTWDARTAAFVDQTGAGDAFSAGFIVAHLARLSLETCLQRAVVTASFAVAGWGCEALLATTRWEAEARWRQWYTSEH